MIFQFNLGIDIQDDKLLISQVKPSLKKIRLVKYAIYSLDEQMPIHEKLNAVRVLIEDFKKENKIGSTDTYIGIPPDIAMFREIDLPIVVRDNLNSTLKYEIGRYIPVSVEDIYFDYQIIFEDRKQNLLRIFLVIVKKKSMQPFLDFCQSLAGGISGIEVSSTAFANSLFYFRKSEEILSDEILFQIAANTGNHSDLLSDLDLPALPSRELPSPQLLPSFGLALKDFWKIPIQINLLPGDMQKRPGRIGKFTMMALSAMLIISILIWSGSHLFRRRMVLNNLNSEISRITPEIKNIDNLENQIEDAEKYIAQFNALFSQDVPTVEILREISQILPKNAWISDFALTENKIRVNGFADSASDLIGMLESSPIFEGVVFLSTIVKEKNGKERFNIGITIVSYE